MSASALPQNLTALAHANEIRLAGCRWRRDVGAMDSAAGRLALASLLDGGEYPQAVGGMRLSRFLTAAKRLGPAAAITICREASLIRRDPRVRELTKRERLAVAVALRRRAEGERLR